MAESSGADDRPEIIPGSIAGLQVEVLAAAGEYTALAALAHTANNMSALGKLAAAAGESEAAFRWMWTIASAGPRPQPQRWEQIRRDLGDGIRIPENLQDAVTQFVLAPVPEQMQQVRQQPQQQLLDPRREVQTLLLKKMDASTLFARDLARSVLEQELGRLPEDVRQAGFALLGASGVVADRKLVFEHTEELLPRDRLGPLAALSVPYSDAEVEQIVEILKKALPIGQSPARSYPGDPPPQTYWEKARKLTAQLPAEDIVELLQEPWTRISAQRADLLEGAIVQDMGLEKLKTLLASDLDEPYLKQLLEVASQALALEELAELGRFSHEVLRPELSRPVRSRLSSYARSSHRGASERSDTAESALSALRDFALLCDDWDTARTYATSLQITELMDAARRIKEVGATGTPLRRFGRVARALLEREAQTFQDNVSDASEVLAEDTAKASFLSGILETEEGSNELAEAPASRQQPGQSVPAPEPPDFTFLATTVLGYQQSIGVLAAAGYGRAIVAAATQADAPVKECLLVAEAAIQNLDDATFKELQKELHWSAMDLGDYGRYVAALSQRLEVLFQETEKALDSLSGPEADVIAPDKLALLLRAALDAGTDTENGAEELGSVTHQPTEHLQRLFGTASRPLHTLAREWAGQLRPEADLVQLIVQTAETTVGAEEEFGRVRRTLAAKLVDETHSPASDWESRGECLELSREADPEIARQAALALAGTGPADFRRRVAKVLADTDAREADEETLRRLAEGETNARVRDQLIAALRNITSGSIGRAVQNLRSLVGLDPEEGPDVDVLLPYEGWHETFVANVDKARQRSGGDPDAYITSLVMLMEVMVEQAAIARFEAAPDNGSVKEREVEAMRRNHSSKPGIGALLAKQHAQSVFPWFNEAIVLRRLRNAHPSPTGSTRPLLLGDDEVIEANALFRRILLGWETSMQDSA